MAIKKRSYRRRRRTGDKKIKNVVKHELAVRRLFKPEMKYYDLYSGGQFINTTPNLNLIGAVQSGTGVRDRIGVKIRVLSVEVKGYFSLGSSAVGSSDIISYGLFVDKQASTIAPSNLSVVPTSDSQFPFNSNASDGLILFPNNIQRTMYTHHTNKMVTINSQLSTQVTLQQFHLHKKFAGGLTVTFDQSNSGTIADILTNAIYFYSIGSQVNTANIRANSQWYSRIIYSDL